MIVAIKTIIES